jgi:hypothetical protein
VEVLLRECELTSVTLAPPAVANWGTADMRQFSTYGGPWAEARAEWTGDGLDTADDEGPLFGDYVNAAFCLKRYEPGDGTDLDKYTRLESESPLVGLIGFEPATA